MSGEMPGAISQVARHSWIVANIPGEDRIRRFEMGGSSGDPFRYFGQGDVAIHGIVHYEPGELMTVVGCLEREKQRYNFEHPDDYFPIPGPNSNTIVDFLLRHCGIHVELPATAIGRDYRGAIGASVTSLGTGVQVETWILGFKLGLEEGVELHVLDLPLGVHLWPPGITVPVNPGRIGFDDSTHRPATQHRRYRSSYDEDRDRRYGLVSLWLWSKYARFAHPNDAAGLSDMATIGFHTRAAYGKTLGYAFGVDLEAGAGFPASFAYAARLYPAGVALMLGDNTFLGAYGGIGSDGVPGRVPARFELPAEVRLEADIAPMARVGVRAGVAWFPGSRARGGGSRLAPFADEVVLSAFARLGRSEPCRCPGHLGRGYFFALERGEIMRSAWLGLSFGVEVDFGG